MASRGAVLTPFSHAINESGREYLLPYTGRCHDGSRQGGDPIANEHQPLAMADAVRKPPREDFEKACGRFCDPFYKADEGFVDPEGVGKKDGYERVDHLRTDIHEKADEPGEENIPTEPEKCALPAHSIL